MQKCHKIIFDIFYSKIHASQFIRNIAILIELSLRHFSAVKQVLNHLLGRYSLVILLKVVRKLSELLQKLLRIAHYLLHLKFLPCSASC